VQFNADVADGMQWKFVPTQREVLPFTIQYTHTYKHKNAHAHSLTPTYSIPNLLIHLKMH
jgi:cytochrome c oxidase assembly protein Cox11